MQRISTATKAIDLFGAGKHGFKDGDLALAIPPTGLDAAWFNGHQEEIASVIEEAGIVLNGTLFTQLRDALHVLYGGRPGHAFTANDWCPLPGGLILQWGSGAISSSGSAFTFPLTFPNLCWAVIPSVFDSAPPSRVVTVVNGSISLFGVQLATNVTGAGQYIALGR